MEYDSSWYRPAEFILLLISMILQIVSISTPWWKIHTYAERPLFGLGSNATLQDLVDNNTTGQTTAESLPEEQFYIGLFYSTKCNASTCETKTLHERHLDRISGSVTGQGKYMKDCRKKVKVCFYSELRL